MKTLRVLSVNVHVGEGLFAGVIPWLFAHLPFVHIVLIQEASRPRARQALRKAFPARKWISAGSDEDDLVGTFVFLRKRRFVSLEKFNTLISKARPPVRGKMPFPQRNLVSIAAIDKKTKRSLLATSVHNWHIVGRALGDGTAVSNGHVEQTIAVAQHHADQWEPGMVSLAGGDWNEHIGSVEDQPLSARTIMWHDAGMVPAGRHQAHLDEVFIRDTPYIRVKTWQYINTPFKAMDHPVLYVVLEVDPL